MPTSTRRGDTRCWAAAGFGGMVTAGHPGEVGRIPPPDGSRSRWPVGVAQGVSLRPGLPRKDAAAVPSTTMSMRSPGLWSGRPVTVLFALVTTVTMTLGVAPSGAVAAGASPSAAAACVPTANPDWSAARVWDEAALDAIRRDLPRPTVHARNLFQ